MNTRLTVGIGSGLVTVVIDKNLQLNSTALLEIQVKSTTASGAVIQSGTNLFMPRRTTLQIQQLN